MSIIAAVVQGSETWLGWDSRISTEDGSCAKSTTPKVFIRGRLAIGAAGRVGFAAQALYGDWPKCTRLTPQYVLQEWLPYAALTEAGRQEVELLFAVPGQLYVCSDGDIWDPGPVAAIGSGLVPALVSLRESRLVKPEKRLLRALECAGEYNIWCGPPYNTARL